MELQISSGRGPAECELAVAKFADAICAEFGGVTVKRRIPGQREGCCKSVVLESERDLSFLAGSVKRVCQSPFRPKHRRKNWFIDTSPLRGFSGQHINRGLICFETFRSGGKGGQNVNKVETGVRAVYPPLGVSAVCTDERSQRMNKKRALERLFALVAEQEAAGRQETEQSNWMRHNGLVRGGAVREYEGLAFRRIR